MLTDYIHNNFDQPTQRKNKNKKANKVSDSSAGKDKKNRQSKSSSSSENERKNSEQNENVDNHHHEHHLAEHLKEKIQEYIGHVKFVPDFVKDNPFIFTGYRINFNTPKKVLKSLFMLHNELVNVWTHLGGAIALIIICIVLCFSVTNLDTQNLNQFVQTEVKDLFEPIYDRLPNFSQFETTRNEIAKFSENTLVSLENKLDSITQDIDQVKKDINPEAIGRLLMKMKDQLEGFAEHFENIHFDKQKLNEMSGKLKAKVSQLQDELLVQIDSSEFDWIDIYKFIHPTYATTKALTEGHHLIPVSRWPIIVFLLSAVFCLMCSAVFHLFYCLNQRANQILLRLDYAGVSILITGSCFPCFVYGFYCLPTYAYTYLTVIGITSLVVFFVSLSDKIHTQEMRKVKSIMYASLGAFAAFPMPHLIYLSWTRTEQNDHLDFSPSLPYYLAMGASYLGGLVIYTSKWPEKCKPGKFDIFGHSHQIWHVCVLLGIVFTYFGAFDNYYTRMEIPCIGCGL